MIDFRVFVNVAKMKYIQLVSLPDGRFAMMFYVGYTQITVGYINVAYVKQSNSGLAL